MGRQAFVLQNCSITQSFSFRRSRISLRLTEVFMAANIICRCPRGSLCYISVYREHIFVCWTVALPVYIVACCLLMFPVGHETLALFSLVGSVSQGLLRLIAVKCPWCVLVCLCGLRSAEYLFYSRFFTSCWEPVTKMHGLFLRAGKTEHLENKTALDFAV